MSGIDLVEPGDSWINDPEQPKRSEGKAPA
jgi:hypothetical protein